MMKKITLAALIVLCSTSAFAQKGGFLDPVTPQGQQQTQGGFSGPTTSLSTVKDVNTMRDDTWVMLEGYIDQRTGNDSYIFRDSTGTLKVDIDDKHWNGQTVTPKDKVRIEGEVDKDWNSVEVDVKNVTIIQ